MIKVVTCLGCSVQFEVKYFLDHVKSCRLAYNIPSMIPRDEVFAKMSYNNHKYFTNRKGEKSLTVSSNQDNLKGHDRESNEIMSKESDSCSFLSNSQKNIPTFKGLSSLNVSKHRSSFNPEPRSNGKTSKERTSDAIEKLRMQRLRLSNNDKYLRDNSDFLSASIKYNDLKRPKITRLNSTKNFRYSNQVNDDEDSDEPDIPSENPGNFSSVELNNENEEYDYSLFSQYQTVPRSVQMVRSSDKNLNSHSKENLDDYNSDNPEEREALMAKSPQEKVIYPLM